MYVSDETIPPELLTAIESGTYRFEPTTALPETSWKSLYDFADTPCRYSDYDVKSWPQFFQPMIDGVKKHDMRNKRDREYKVGDIMLLREFDPFGGGYTGRSARFRITYITSNDTPCALSSVGLGDDMAILSVELLESVQCH